MCDKCNVTKVMWQMQYNKCIMQWEKCNGTNVMRQIRRNWINEMWQTQCDGYNTTIWQMYAECPVNSIPTCIRKWYPSVG